MKPHNWWWDVFTSALSLATDLKWVPSFPREVTHSLTLLFNTRGVGWARQMDYWEVSTMTEERIQHASHMCDIFKETKNLTLSSIHQTINHQRELGKGPRPGQARRFGGPARARLGVRQFSSFTVSPGQMQLILELPAALNDPTQLLSLLVDNQELMWNGDCKEH